jgi:predicted nucleic acid-binding protein
MPRRKATIDTSCLIALNQLRLLETLSILFDKVYVPKAVLHELSRRGGERRQVLASLRRLALLQRCNVADPVRVRLLLIEKRRGSTRPKKDWGEAEAVIQATEVGAGTVIIDDPLGRSWAEGHRLNPHGLLWILRELRRFGAIRELRPYIRGLQAMQYRMPAESVRELMLEFQEEPE